MMGKPKIRFKGYNEDWEQRKLGEVFEFQYGEFNNNPDNGGEYPIYGANGIIGGYTDWNAENSSIIGHMGAYAGYVVWGEGKHFVTYNGTIARPKDNSIDSKYGYYLLDSKKIYKICAGSGQPFVSYSDLNGIDILLPKDKDEQRLLAYYFTNLDHLITLHQHKCDEMKKLKKCMLQKMFPQNGKKVPEIRFEGFTNDWEQRKLEDFGKATGGTSIESEFSEDGVYKVISIGSYSENSVYNDQGIRAIKSDKTSNRVLNRNDLTMILNDKTTSGNIIGRVLLIEESGIYVYNQRTERIEINLDEYDPVFLYEMLNAPNIREKIIKQAQGNTQIYVNWTTISLLEYMIPSKEEQVKIGEHLHGISNLIALHQHKCDELQNLKKYMLQNMFV